MSLDEVAYKKCIKSGARLYQFVGTMEEMKGIELILMIGLPGSGKTTFIKTLSQYFVDQTCNKEPPYDVHVIAYDELIPISIQKGLDEATSWKEARRNILQQTESLVKRLKESTSTLPNESNKYPNRTLIFIDDNMYYRSMRYEYFQLARSYSLSFCQLYLSCSVEEAIKNNINRSTGRVPSEVITQMSTKLQPPDTINNKWEHNSLTITSGKVDIHSVYKLIASCLDHPVPPLIQHQLLLEQGKTSSLIHEADLELRKLVGRAMKEASPGNKQQLCRLAASLNATRLGVLARLRAGDTTLPASDDVPHFLTQQMSCDH